MEHFFILIVMFIQNAQLLARYLHHHFSKSLRSKCANNVQLKPENSSFSWSSSALKWKRGRKEYTSKPSWQTATTLGWIPNFLPLHLRKPESTRYTPKESMACRWGRNQAFPAFPPTPYIPRGCVYGSRAPQSLPGRPHLPQRSVGDRHTILRERLQYFFFF